MKDFVYAAVSDVVNNVVVRGAAEELSVSEALGVSMACQHALNRRDDIPSPGRNANAVASPSFWDLTACGW